MAPAIRDCCIALLAAAASYGCSSSAVPLESRLDLNTGVTVQTLETPIVLARPIPRLATSARDYAYLGPVEINRMGTREYFLWIAMGSTLDRSFVGEPRPTATTLHLMLDGEPMPLPLSAWHQDIATPPYAVGTPVHEHLRTRVSLDQLRRIARAGSIDVHIAAADMTTDRYRLWDGRWGELAKFTNEVADSPSDSTTRVSAHEP
ncbi:MAG: hypothetical protein ACR2QV_12485 [Gammaproteobacteria bacterium]